MGSIDVLSFKYFPSSLELVRHTIDGHEIDTNMIGSTESANNI